MGHTVGSHTLCPSQGQGKMKAALPKMGDLSVGLLSAENYTSLQSFGDTCSIYYLDVSTQTNKQTNKSFFFPV